MSGPLIKTNCEPNRARYVVSINKPKPNPAKTLLYCNYVPQSSTKRFPLRISVVNKPFA